MDLQPRGAADRRRALTGAPDIYATPTSDPGKESRLASGIPVVPAFDGYRAYAIMGIVVLHVLIFSGVLPAAGTSFYYRFVQGTFGQLVDVLFIISGFVVFLPTVARRGEFGGLGAYAIRRAARLVPAYWAMLALILLLVALFAVTPPIEPPSLASVGAHALFLQTPVALVHPFPMGFGVDGPVWTLSLEVAFYLLLPLIAGWYFRRPILGLALAGAITALWHEAIIHYDTVTSWLGVQPSPETSFRLQANALIQFPYFAFSFAAGMTGAWAYVRLRELHPASTLVRRAFAVQLVSLAALALFAYLAGRNGVRGGVVLGAEFGRRSPVIALGFSGALATLMVSTALGAATWQRPFANRFARRLGDISYGIYLIHVVIVTYALGLISIPRGDSVGGFAGSHPTAVPGDGSLGALLLLAAIVIPASVLYGYLSARFVEQPIRRWAHRFGRRGQELASAERRVAYTS